MTMLSTRTTLLAWKIVVGVWCWIAVHFAKDDFRFRWLLVPRSLLESVQNITLRFTYVGLSVVYNMVKRAEKKKKKHNSH